MIAQDVVAAVTPVVETLERLGVTYYIGGSVASSLHGKPRATADVDLVADLRIEHVRRLVTALESAFYIAEEAVREAIQRHSSFNVISNEHLIKIDIFVAGSESHNRVALGHVVERRLGSELTERTFRIASAEDTVIRKLAWFRLGGEVSERQWTDVQEVLRAQAVSLDIPDRHQWAPSLGIADLLDRALSQAGLA